MSDENQQFDMNDPLGLGVDLNTVDTTRPAIVDGLVMLRLSGAEVKQNKAGSGRNLALQFETINPQTSTKGREKGIENDLNPGFKVFKFLPLQQSENPKAPDFREDIARYQDALMGTSQGNRPPFNPTQCIGNLVLARLKVENSDEFGLSNSITKVEHPPTD